LSNLDFYHDDDLLAGCEVIEPEPIKRITLSKDFRSWLATFHGDAEMVEAFGTDTIPTAFTTEANAEEVAAAIAAKNPDHQIWYLGRRMDE
jgi:hypothetical protein